MIGRLVLRYLALRPVRSLVFVGAYAAGVSVMLALLSIGDVMVEQARDEQWVGGGEVTVLPAGVDLETLRMGGAIFYGIEQARFLAREVLGGPRLAQAVRAVAPWIDDRALYIRRSGAAHAVAVRANGMIPSAARALGAAPDLLSGAFEDSEMDRRWLRPTPFELYSEIDRFHRPPARLRGDTTWAEWHYFNLLWPGEERWLYLSYIVGGDVSGSRWSGVALARYRTPDGRDRVYADSVGAEQIRFSELTPDLTFGPHSVRLIDAPARYRVQAQLPAREGGPALDIELEIQPEPRRYFPPAELAASDSLVSGYVVPALRARAVGRVCVGGRCAAAEPTTAYHDHNWGTWGGVIWDWGIAHAGDLDLLYGGVHGSAAEEARRAGARFLVYVVDSLGVSAVLQMDELRYSGWQPQVVHGETVDVPARLTWMAARGRDSLVAEIGIEHTSLSRLSVSNDRGAYFTQMRGRLQLTGVLGKWAVSARGPGLFETYISGE